MVDMAHIAGLVATGLHLTLWNMLILLRLRHIKLYVDLVGYDFM